MKALVLVGGFGTRLRPLTLEKPKPLLHFCNRPILERQIAALVAAGVDEVILAVAHQPAVMQDALTDMSDSLSVKIRCSLEKTPLGTAGPLKLAEAMLKENCAAEEPFFVMNSDIICDFPLREMLTKHREKGAEATILVTRVEDPSSFGVVVRDETTQKIICFAEKPKDCVSNLINAGVYVINPSVIDLIELRPCSIEREVFPQLAVRGTLYAHDLAGYWADIGKPESYLQGLRLHLAFLRTKAEDPDFAEKLTSPTLLKGVEGNVLIDKSAQIGEDCAIGPNVCIGANCIIGRGVRIRNAAIMQDVKIENYASIDEAIIGFGSELQRWTHIEGLTVMAEDVRVTEGVCINASQILPHLTIRNSVHTGTIIM